MAKYKNDLRCSFCGKSQDEVRKLIAGPDGVFICNECVDICVGIIEEEYDFDDVDLDSTKLGKKDKDKNAKISEVLKDSEKVKNFAHKVYTEKNIRRSKFSYADRSWQCSFSLHYGGTRPKSSFKSISE